MNIELWPPPTKVGDIGDVQVVVHFWVRDDFKLKGDVKFVNLLRLQFCQYVAEPQNVRINVDHNCIQFMVENAVFARLEHQFTGIVANFVRDYVEQRQKGTTNGL